MLIPFGRWCFPNLVAEMLRVLFLLSLQDARMLARNISGMIRDKKENRRFQVIIPLLDESL